MVAKVYFHIIKRNIKNGEIIKDKIGIRLHFDSSFSTFLEESST
jgi:hypothetical protein